MPKFDYEPPYTSELQELYITPYRFSNELQAYIIYMFQHPTKFRHRETFTRLMKPSDPNDMIKPAYLIIKDYLANPQRYGHSLNHLSTIIVSRMWKVFLALHKLRGEKYSAVLRSDTKLNSLFEDRFLDIILSDIRTGNYIGTNDEMVKERKGVGLRERKPFAYSEEALKYYESLDC